MPVDAADVLLVFTSLPDESAAQQLARDLVDSRLAACVSVFAPCASTYRWRGLVEQASEVPVVIKTTARRYAELESALRARHPYELPEIVAVPLARGLPAYLEWVAAETG
jgi:periplasmic divalent cation tolerance protein